MSARAVPQMPLLAGAGPAVLSSPRPVVSRLRDARALYEAHFAFVWRNLRRLGVAPERLEDVAQEVFLVVHRRWKSFDATSASEQTWLFGIALRVAQNERRASRRRTAFMTPAREPRFLEAIPSEAASPVEVVAKRQAARLLDRALDALSDSERAVFVMVELELMSVPQTAHALGLNLNTAYGRLRAARAEFQRALSRFRAQMDRGRSPE